MITETYRVNQRTNPPKKSTSAKSHRSKKHSTLRSLLFLISFSIFIYIGVQLFWGAAPPLPLYPIEPLLQNPELPNGCEAVSAATLLRSYGVEANAVDLAMNYIPRGSITYNDNKRYAPDPETCYVGDPTSKRGGWYCFESALIEGSNRYLSALGSDLQLEKISGKSIEQLEHYLTNGYPVIVWLTSDYQTPEFNHSFTWILPNGREYIPYNNLHCVLLERIDNDNVYIADPLQGEKVISKQLFKELFEEMGKRAVMVK